jgi:hypothetical protein
VDEPIDGPFPCIHALRSTRRETPYLRASTLSPTRSPIANGKAQTSLLPSTDHHEHTLRSGSVLRAHDASSSKRRDADRLRNTQLRFLWKASRCLLQQRSQSPGELGRRPQALWTGRSCDLERLGIDAWTRILLIVPAALRTRVHRLPVQLHPITGWIMPSNPSGTVTFLFTDVEGSTRRWEEHRTIMKDAMERRDSIVRTLNESDGGAVSTAAGDESCSAFSLPHHALHQTARHPQHARAVLIAAPSPLPTSPAPGQRWVRRLPPTRGRPQTVHHRTTDAVLGCSGSSDSVCGSP